MPTKEERDWAMFCHLSSLLGYVIPCGGFIAPIVIWSLKRHESEFIDDQGREAINFNLSLIIYFTIAVLLTFVVIGVPLLIGLAIFELIVVIVAAVRASAGEYYRYPMTIRFL